MPRPALPRRQDRPDLVTPILSWPTRLSTLHHSRPHRIVPRRLTAPLQPNAAPTRMISRTTPHHTWLSFQTISARGNLAVQGIWCSKIVAAEQIAPRRRAQPSRVDSVPASACRSEPGQHDQTVQPKPHHTDPCRAALLLCYCVPTLARFPAHRGAWREDNFCKGDSLWPSR